MAAHRVQTTEEPVADAGHDAGAGDLHAGIVPAERMERVERAPMTDPVAALARGVAHDFNNLLTVIRVHAEFLRDAFAEGSEERADADEIIRASDRAACLTTQLLAFSRKQVLQPAPLDVATLATQLEPMLRRLVGANIELATITPPAPASAIADRGLLEQVLINLVAISRDAMPQGGQILIETATTTLGDAFEPVRRGEIAAGDCVVLTVLHTKADNPEERAGQSAGASLTAAVSRNDARLGLPTVYEIVKRAGGCVTVQREDAIGVAFRVYLPFAAEIEATELSWPAGRRETHDGETVLLVEDEAAVRGIARRVLEGHGYRVLVARHGVDALRLAAAHNGEIHLLLTDMIMPELGGHELIERMRNARPNIAVVCMSGYTHLELGAAELPAAVAFLPKPFGERELATIVRRTIDRANPRRAPGI